MQRARYVQIVRKALHTAFEAVRIFSSDDVNKERTQNYEGFCKLRDMIRMTVISMLRIFQRKKLLDDHVDDILSFSLCKQQFGPIITRPEF